MIVHPQVLERANQAVTRAPVRPAHHRAQQDIDISVAAHQCCHRHSLRMIAILCHMDQRGLRSVNPQPIRQLHPPSLLRKLPDPQIEERPLAREFDSIVASLGGMHHHLGNRHLRSSMQAKANLRTENPVATETMLAVSLDK